MGGGRGRLADGALLERVDALARLVKMVKKMHYYRQTNHTVEKNGY